MSRVSLRFRCRINPSNRQLRLRVTQSVGYVCGGIGRRQMHGKPALGQGDLELAHERSEVGIVGPRVHLRDEEDFHR